MADDKEKDEENSGTPLSDVKPPWARGEREDDKSSKQSPSPVDDDDDDDDDDDEEAASKPVAKATPSQSSVSSKSALNAAVDDDDDDDDEDVEPPPPPKKKQKKTAGKRPGAKPKSKRPMATVAAHKSAKPPAKPEPDADDTLPDWAPWVVLIGLLLLGALGALGVFSKKGGSAESSDTTTTQPETAAEAPAADDPNATVSASHLLVQYQGSMRAGPNVTRSKDEAKKRAEEALAKAKKGADFQKLVGEYSDEPGAKLRHGNLGKFTRQAMVKPFSDAAFKLKAGEISGLVETPFGFHVIKRTE